MDWYNEVIEDREVEYHKTRERWNVTSGPRIWKISVDGVCRSFIFRSLGNARSFAHKFRMGDADKPYFDHIAHKVVWDMLPGSLLADVNKMISSGLHEESLSPAVRRAVRWLKFTGSRPAAHCCSICCLLNKKCGTHRRNCHKHPLPRCLVDHPQTFLRGDKPFAWTVQPYGHTFKLDGKVSRLRRKYRETLDEFCSLHGLTWFEDFGGSWWYPGETTLVAVMQGDYDREFINDKARP